MAEGGGMPLLASVDPSARIDFYVQHGLVRRAPTLEQLERAERQNTQQGAGVIQRIRWFARHPWGRRPSEASRQRS